MATALRSLRLAAIAPPVGALAPPDARYNKVRHLDAGAPSCELAAVVSKRPDAPSVTVPPAHFVAEPHGGRRPPADAGRRACAPRTLADAHCSPMPSRGAHFGASASHTSAGAATSMQGRPCGCGHAGSGTRCQRTSGRNCSTVTRPSVARSMAGQRSGGGLPFQPITDGGLMPSMRATAVGPPREMMMFDTTGS